MTAQERRVAMSAARAVERMVAGEALAKLPELFAMHHAHGPSHASIAFSYIANRLFRLAAKPDDLQ